MPALANARHERFCQEYIIDLNITRAAKDANFSKKTARTIGSKLLTRVDIQERIAELNTKRDKRTELTQDWIIKELKLIGGSDIQNYIDIDPNTGAIRAKGFEEMPAETSRALRSIKEDRVIKEDADGKKVTVYDKVNFSMYDKIRALEILAKHKGMLVERHEVTGEDGGPVKIEYVLIKAKKKKRGGDGKGDGK